MTLKFKNKYRIESTRLRNWDYSWKAVYYVTIKTMKNRPYFGNLINNQMYHSDIGKKVYSEWFRIISLRPDMNLKLDAFVVMPDHVHGIIIIGPNKFNEYSKYENIPSNQYARNGCIDAMHGVYTVAIVVNSNFM